MGEAVALRAVTSCWAGTPEEVARDIREYEVRRGGFAAVRVYALPDGKIFVLILDEAGGEEVNE